MGAAIICACTLLKKNKIEINIVGRNLKKTFIKASLVI
jgi:hypothetical protein